MQERGFDPAVSLFPHAGYIYNLVYLSTLMLGSDLSFTD